jgi:hypothetical protein
MRLHRLGHDHLAPVVWMQQKPNLITLVHARGTNDPPVNIDHEICGVLLARCYQSIKILLGTGWAIVRSRRPIGHRTQVTKDRIEVHQIILKGGPQDQAFGAQGHA